MTDRPTGKSTDAVHGSVRGNKAGPVATPVVRASTFGLLAAVPQRPYRELAFAMGVGVLLDSVLVRALLLPSLLRVLGPASGWPSRYLYDRRKGLPGPSGRVADRPHVPAT